MPLKTSALYWNPSKKKHKKILQIYKSYGDKKTGPQKNDNLEQLTVKDRQKKQGCGEHTFFI